ncbi:MAG: Maf family protein [Desulfonauticus sp.]|nr:Maf family protein [Desulfonauticus sp.]
MNNIFINKTDLVLASKSPRRQDLLAKLGLHFYVQPSQIKEKISQDLTPEKLVQTLAEQKARKVSSSFPNAAILGADTIVVLKGSILGKPKDKKQAFDYLKKLQGQRHLVFTGVCVLLKKQIKTIAVKTEVHIAQFSDDVLKKYIQTTEPLDKAGAYAIQGIGSFLIEKIKGSYTNVIGLPLTETTRLLLEMDVIDWS